MSTATDPKTGQRYELIGGRWVPMSPAASPAETQPRPAKGAPSEYAQEPLGAIQAGLVGAGDTFNTIGINAREMWASLTGDREGQIEAARDRVGASRVRAQLHETNPIAATVGSMLPGLIAAPLGGAGIAGQLGMGAAISGATSQSGDMLRDAALGGALGAAGMGGQQVVQRVWAARQALKAQRGALSGGLLTDGEKEVIEGARRAGIAVTPGQASGSRAMRDFEAQVARVPGAGVVFAELEQANKQQLAALAARAMGVEANSVSAEARAYAENQLGQKFQEIAEKIGTVNTAPLRKKIEELAADELTQGFPTSAAAKMRSLYEKGAKGRESAAAGSGEQMTGQMLMNMRSVASSEMRHAFGEGRHLEGQIFNEALDSIDDVIHKSALARGGTDLADTYRQTREQWNVLRAMNRGGAAPDGSVNAAAAMRLLRGGDESGAWGRAAKDGSTLQTRGSGILGQNPTGDLYDALRFMNSPIGRPSMPMTGASMAMAMQLGGMPGLAAGAARRLAAAPMARWYAGLSPEAAAVAAGAVAAMNKPGPAPAMVDILRTGGAGAFGGSL